MIPSIAKEEGTEVALQIVILQRRCCVKGHICTLSLQFMTNAVLFKVFLKKHFKNSHFGLSKQREARQAGWFRHGRKFILEVNYLFCTQYMYL